MRSEWKSLVVLLSLLLIVSNGEERTTFRERAMKIARRISKYQEQLAEFAKTVQNVNLVCFSVFVLKLLCLLYFTSNVGRPKHNHQR